MSDLADSHRQASIFMWDMSYYAFAGGLVLFFTALIFAAVWNFAHPGDITVWSMLGILAAWAMSIPLSIGLGMISHLHLAVADTLDRRAHEKNLEIGIEDDWIDFIERGDLR